MFAEYNKSKVLEVLLYIANRKSIIDRHGLSKILYFSDRLHLERFGRTISGDDYVKMEFGPVPSRIYDYIKDINENNEHFSSKGYQIKPKRTANIDELSESDIDVLDEIIDDIGSKTFTERTNLSHDKAYENSKMGSFIDEDNFLLGIEHSDEIKEMQNID